jgi:signal transduction histidine kinase
VRKVGVKTTLIIGAYSLLVTCAFLVGLFVLNASLQRNLQAEMDGVGGVFIMSPKDIYDGIVIDGNPMYGGEMITPDALSGFFAAQLTRLLPTIAVCFCVFLLGSSALLWLLLLRAEQRRIQRLVKNLDSISEDTAPVIDDSAFADAYGRLYALFERHLDDYKKLQAYLTHEQKNNIAILRADPVLQQNPTHARILAAIADSIDDIVTLSDSADGGDIGEVDVSLVCAEACDAYKHTADIRFDFDEHLSYEIAAKERWIYRAVCNLLDNAVKYGGGNPIEVAVRREHDSVIIIVRDHGIGISDEEQNKIFTHLYRVRELNRDGYGIGLSLVSHVCDLCGGFVYVDSAVGDGSTFYLAFNAS